MKRQDSVRRDLVRDKEIIKCTCHLTSSPYFARLGLFQSPLFLFCRPFKPEQKDTKRGKKGEKEQRAHSHLQVVFRQVHLADDVSSSSSSSLAEEDNSAATQHPTPPTPTSSCNNKKKPSLTC